MKASTVGLVAALAAALAAGSASAAPAYHPAQTPAEQALGKILKADADHPDAVDPAVELGSGRPPTKPPAGAPYLKYLTTPLATSILVDEANQVKKNCGGRYRRGEECGMGADPIICAQDFPDSYLFRTTDVRPDSILIEAAWPPDPGKAPEVSGSYRLKQVGGVWKLDAISCSGGDRYHWVGK
jgi:hypothetical protein